MFVVEIERLLMICIYKVWSTVVILYFKQPIMHNNRMYT